MASEFLRSRNLCGAAAGVTGRIIGAAGTALAASGFGNETSFVIVSTGWAWAPSSCANADAQTNSGIRIEKPARVFIRGGLLESRNSGLPSCAKGPQCEIEVSTYAAKERDLEEKPAYSTPTIAIPF